MRVSLFPEDQQQIVKQFARIRPAGARGGMPGQQQRAQRVRRGEPTRDAGICLARGREMKDRIHPSIMPATCAQKQGAGSCPPAPASDRPAPAWAPDRFPPNDQNLKPAAMP